MPAIYLLEAGAFRKSRYNLGMNSVTNKISGTALLSEEGGRP